MSEKDDTIERPNLKFDMVDNATLNDEDKKKANFLGAMDKQIDCRRCGLCCIVWQIPITSEDVDREPVLENHLTIPLDGIHRFLMGSTEKNIPCPFYGRDKSECTIYETRPARCRTFIPTPRNCMSAYIETSGIGVDASVKEWREQGIDELTKASRIFAQYFKMIERELSFSLIFGGRSLKQRLADDPLLKIIKEYSTNG